MCHIDDVLSVMVYMMSVMVFFGICAECAFWVWLFGEAYQKVVLALKRGQSYRWWWKQVVWTVALTYLISLVVGVDLPLSPWERISTQWQLSLASCLFGIKYWTL